MQRPLLLASALLAAGCVLSGTFTRTGDQHFPARPPSCSFAVYSIPPDGFIELGLVEFQGGQMGGAMSLGEARQLAAPHVCAAGGDGLVVGQEAGEILSIRRATVIKVAPRP